MLRDTCLCIFFNVKKKNGGEKRQEVHKEEKIAKRGRVPKTSLPYFVIYLQNPSQ